jgi:hypothetical protein
MGTQTTKMKRAITAIAIAATLMTGASSVKANAYLELISGSTVWSDSSATDNINTGSSGITVGSWDIVFSSGSSTGFNGLIAQLNTQAQGSSPANGLTVIYSSGDPYTYYGNWTYGESVSGVSSVGAAASVYQSTILYNGANTLGTQLGTTLTIGATGPGGGSTGETGVIGSPAYYLNEVLNIGGGASSALSGGSQNWNGGATFNVNTAVPDGGMTLVLLGSALTVIFGLAHKFGARQLD